jgi:hypothetical protein
MGMKRGRKVLSLIAAAAMAMAAAGMSWAGIESGRLNNDYDDVDLSVLNSYYENSPKNPITLGGNSSVTITTNLILGDKDVPGYAAEPTDEASKLAAGGAIFVDSGQILTIRPESEKSVSGRPGKVSSLRLFGGGTTNLYAGSGSRYSATFLQSGRLNIEKKDALGGSEVTLGGGASIGLISNNTVLDLTGVPLYARRYDTETKVTFDTGADSASHIKIDGLRQLTNSQNSSAGDITLVKNGGGTLAISGGTTDITGGFVVENGVLEFGTLPIKSQAVEVKEGASLSSTVKLLTSVTLKPHSGSYLSVPAIASEAKFGPEGTGDAALYLAKVDKSALLSSPLKIKADFSGLKKPSGADENEYYVKLLNVVNHGLALSDVAIEGAVPAGFAASGYAARPFIDNDNVYAVISKDSAIAKSIAVTVVRSGPAVKITAALSDGAGDRTVKFDILNSAGSLLNTKQAATTSSGEAYSEFDGLANGLYKVTAASDGYRSAEAEFVIDGSVDESGTFGVTAYNAGTANGLIYVVVENKSGASFPNGTEFKYRFIEQGSSASGRGANPVTNATSFSAKDVKFNSNRTRARFLINLNDLTCDEGNKFTLVAGKVYKIRVDGAGTMSGGTGISTVLVNGAGEYSPPDSYSTNVQAAVSGGKITSSVTVLFNGIPPQGGIIVEFSLRDQFGSRVQLSGVQTAFTRLTDEFGKAQAEFANIPAGHYVVSISSPNFDFTGLSNDVEIAGSGGGGGGCSSGIGALALLGALAVLRRK